MSQARALILAPLAAPQRHHWIDWLVPSLVVAYLTWSRSFAHCGVAPLYIGELALAAMLLAHSEAVWGSWLHAGLKKGPFSIFALLLVVSVSYGVFQAVRGVLLGFSPMIALQNLVFHTYPLYFFPGVWVARRHPQALPRLIRGLAWIHGIYGVLFAVAFAPLGLTEPDLDGVKTVGWYGQPYGAAVVLLGLISFEPRLMRVWFPFLLNVFVLLAMQVRAAWLSLAITLPIWGILMRRAQQVALVFVAAAVLLVVGLITNVELPGPSTRSEKLTARLVVGRALAAIDPQLASNFTRDADAYAGTVSWRTDWWREIVKMIHASPVTTVVGPGYGYPIWDLHPLDLGDDPLRTPHNVTMYALGYTGWMGVAMFYALQVALAALLWKVYRRTGQAFGICYLLMIVVWAQFDNFYEAPFGAIPFYLLLGMAAAPALDWREHKLRRSEQTTARRHT